MIAVWIADGVAALSLLLGGAISTAGNAVFAWWYLRQSGEVPAQTFVRALYRGELAKILLTVALFSLVFTTLRHLDFILLLAAYILVQMTHWFASIVLRE